MEVALMLVVLCCVGTIVGVLAGTMMMNRRNRLSPTGAQLAALQKEPASPQGPIAPGVNLEDIRKLVADRDDALRQMHEDLQRAQAERQQVQLERDLAQGQASEAQQQYQQVREQWEQAQQQYQHAREQWEQAQAQQAQASSQSEQARAESQQQAQTQLEQAKAEAQQAQADVQQAKTDLEQAKAQAQQEAQQLAAAEQRIEELTAQVTVLSHKAAEMDVRAREQEDDFAARVAKLAEQLAAATHTTEEEGSYRTSLESQITAHGEEIRQLTAQVDTLTRDLAAAEAHYEEQRKLADKGLEFLSMAQDHLAGVFRNGHQNGVEARAESAVAAD